VKRLSILFCVLLLVLSLCAGCTDAAPPANTPTPTPTDSAIRSPDTDTFALEALSAFLDQERFSEQTTETEIYDQMKKYKYNGKPLYDQLSLGCLDYTDGGETSGYKEGVAGLIVSYRSGSEPKSANFIIMFRAETALEGLALPSDIDFENTLPDILEKLHLPFLTFQSDSEGSNEMTLIEEDPCKLVVINDDEGVSLYFTEESVCTKSNGTVCRSVRSVTLNFDGDYDCKTARLSSVTLRLDQHLKFAKE
jgi:hypothetical protein